MQKQKEIISLQQTGLNFFNDRTEKSFTAVYHRMKPGISVYLKDRVPGMDYREEIIATTFAKVWSKIHQYDPYWNFSTWVYRIALNESRLFYRSKRRTYSYDAMEEMGINMEAKAGQDELKDFSDDDIQPAEMLAEIVLEEIENLPEMYKSVLTLREVEKKKYEDIADELGLITNTVRTRIHKARRLIRAKIQDRSPELLKMYQDQL